MRYKNKYKDLGSTGNSVFFGIFVFVWGVFLVMIVIKVMY